MNMNEQQQLDELLGAYALNAVDDVERAEIDAYLERSPRAAAEVADHLYVAAALAGSISEAPAPSFDRISAAIDAANTAPAVAVPATTVPAVGAPTPTTAPVIPIASRRRRPAAMWLTSAAAAVAIGALGFQSVRTGQQLDTAKTNLAAQQQASQQLSAQLEASKRESQDAFSVQRVATSPGARIAELKQGVEPVGRVLLDSNGRGFLELTSTQTLEAGKAYQLWGVQDKKVISLGVMKAGITAMPLSAAGNWTQFVLTVESLPGVVASEGPAVAQGTFTF